MSVHECLLAFVLASGCSGDDGATASGTSTSVAPSSGEATTSGEATSSGDPTTVGTSTTSTTGDSAATTDAPGTTSSGADSSTTGGPLCLVYDSDEEEFAPVQIVGAGLPPGAELRTWSLPTIYEYIGPFAGVPGEPASHEGIDYVHAGADVPEIAVVAAADGVVAYARTGCPQSQLFGFNNALRECGSGWGNHVIVDHGGGIYTRYAHLHPGAIAVSVGDAIARGDAVGVMGNSGRSDQRHLHFELASHAGSLDPCQPAQSLDLVYDPAGLF